MRLKKKQSRTLFFQEDGNVYGYGACNYFAGKFKSNNDGEFLITQLKRSNETCDNDDDIEVKLMASMLMSNRFKIEAGQLKLMSDQQLTVAFEPKADVNRNELIKQATLLKARKKVTSSERKKGKKQKGKKSTIKKASEKTIKGKNAKGTKSNGAKVSKPKKSSTAKAATAKGKTSASLPKTKAKQVKAK